jgi:hypothetical protein
METVFLLISAVHSVEGALFESRKIRRRAVDAIAAMFAMDGHPQRLHPLADGEFQIRAHAMLASPESADGTAFRQY